MLKKAALITGIGFIAIGILGFVPGITVTNDMGMKLLLGLFMVGVLHNIIHLGSGIFALVGSSTESGSRLYFKVFGLVYALVTILGFIEGNTVLGILPVNLADNFLHLFFTIVFLGYGFAYKDRTARA